MAIKPDPSNDPSSLRLPTAAKLSHDHPELCSGLTKPFSPSDLLTSLLPNSLPGIARELNRYDEVISAELQGIVDEEYRDFIDLAARLAGERQRIDRLAHWADKASQEGLEGVRKRVQREKDYVHAAQLGVEDLIRAKDDAELRRSDLQLLLSFSDALHRLESLLSVQHTTEPASSLNQLREQRRKSLGNITALPEGDSASENRDDDDADIDLMALQEIDEGSENEEHIIEDEAGFSDASQDHQYGTLQGLSIRSRADEGHKDHLQVDLPTRISRAKSSWERVSFLRRAALAPKQLSRAFDALDGAHTRSPLAPFVESHQERLVVVEKAIKKDLHQLLTCLLSPGSALLEEEHRMDTSQGLANAEEGSVTSRLRRWSQLAPGHPAEECQSEQKAWLLLSLDTWIKVSATPGQGVAELREVIAEMTVRAWIDMNMQSTMHSGTSPAATSNQRVSDTTQPSDFIGKPSPFASIYDLFYQYVRSYRAIIVATDSFRFTDAGVATSDDTLRVGMFEKIFWVHFSDALADRFGNVLFYVGRLDEFHCNYQATQAFLDALEHLAPSGETARAWRSHPSFLGFEKKWQLSVYFQMRYRQIATAYEGELVSSQLARDASVGLVKVPLLEATRATLAAFVAPWRPGSHLNPLCAKEWRLSLLVLSRYHWWLCGQLPPDVRSYSSSTSANSKNKNFEGDPACSASTPMIASTPDTLGSQAQANQLLRTLTVLVADASWLVEQMPHHFRNLIASQLPQQRQSNRGNSKSREVLIEQMLASAKEVLPFQETLLAPVSERITKILKDRCAEPLRLVRSVSSTSYRSGVSTPASNSGPDGDPEVEPSYFVPQILRALRQFFGLGDRPGEKSLTTAALLNEEIKSQWAISVVEDVAMRYAASLNQMVQNFESLKRLKRGGTGVGSGGFGGLASSILGRSNKGALASGKDLDCERMQAQMRADVKRLEKDVHCLGEVGININLDANEAWKRLREVIAGGND